MRDACHRVVSWPRRGRVVAAFLAASIHKDGEHDDSHCCKWIPGRSGRARCGAGRRTAGPWRDWRICGSGAAQWRWPPPPLHAPARRRLLSGHARCLARRSHGCRHLEWPRPARAARSISAGRSRHRLCDGPPATHPPRPGGGGAQGGGALIAIDAEGVLGWGNSERVLRRSDLGQFQRDDGSARVAILHNSIFSCAPLAEQVGALAWAQLTGLAGPIGWVRLAAAVPRRIAHRDRVHIDPSGAITAIDSANPYVSTNLHRTTVAYLGSEVWRHGVCVGRVMTELVADVADGMVMPFGDAAHDAFLMRTDHVAS